MRNKCFLPSTSNKSEKENYKTISDLPILYYYTLKELNINYTEPEI